MTSAVLTMRRLAVDEMGNFLNHSEFLTMLRRRFTSCEPCQVCGELGTWPVGPCPSCASGGDQSDIEARLEQKLQRLREDRTGTLLAAGVPKRLAGVAFEAPERWPVDRRRPDFRADKWSGQPWAITMIGPTGTGKSVMATELLFRFLCSGRSGWFERASRVPRIYFSSKDEKFAELVLVRVLVVDDVGHGHLGGAWEAIGELLAARYDDKKPTIITTNLGLHEIAEFDAHAADRLFDGLLIVVSGASRRGLRADS